MRKSDLWGHGSGCAVSSANRRKLGTSVLAWALAGLLMALAPVTRGQAPAAFSRLYQFSPLSIDMNGNLDGVSPAALIQASDGNFYGTAPQGGQVDSALGAGTIFKVTPGGAFTTLHEFSGGRDGGIPYGSLLQGSDGNFYGTTSDGGGSTFDDPGYGTVFRLTPAGEITTLYHFNLLDGNNANADGADPTCGLIQDGDGNLYGTTQKGGAGGNGTVFRLSPAGALTTLHAFSATDSNHANADGARPTAGLTKGNDGNFYGTTFYGGPSGYGTVFQLTPAGALTTLASFNHDNGEHPSAVLLQGSNGNFWGTTLGGGTSSQGTIFQIAPNGTLTSLYSFGGKDGANPWAGLTFGSDGNFYGTTYNGGANAGGSVFQITPAGTLTTVYSFSAPEPSQEPGFYVNRDGLFPMSALVQGGDGNFYGVTTLGGAGDDGTIFRLAPAGVLAITSPAAATVLVGHAFTYPLAATGSPDTVTVANLPAGLIYDAASGVISGVPPALGTFPIMLSASGAGGKVTMSLVLSVVDYPVATVSSVASSVKVGSGGVGEFVVSLSAAQADAVVVNFTIKGTATNGTDYVLLKAFKKFKAGQTTKFIVVTPRGDLGGTNKKTVKLMLEPGAGYTVGTTAASAKVKLIR